MKVSLSFEKTCSKDVSIMVDTLRASTTITVALNNFKEIIPAFTPEQAITIAKEKNAIVAGERKGKKIDGFDIGNSPESVENYKTDKEILVLTTSNGTRVIENMDSTVLIGTFTNAKSVAKAGLEIAKEHIDVVMAGFKGDFTLEDYLGAGEILYWIEKELNKNKIEKSDKEIKWKDKTGLSEYAKSAVLASRDEKLVNEYIKNKTKSGKRLRYLGQNKDVEFCLKRNISENVAIYRDGKLVLYKNRCE